MTDVGMAKFSEYGLVGLMAGAVILLLFFVVKWTLATTKDILAQAAIEREKSTVIHLSFIKSIDDLRTTMTRHDEKADERGKYIRDEHERFAKNQDIVCSNLKQIEQALGRINGYKHD